MDEPAHVHMMTYGMEPQVQALRQGVTPMSQDDAREFVSIFAQRDRSKLCSLMMAGHVIYRPIPCGQHVVNPLLTALRHNRVPDSENMVALLDTMQTLLLANCDPNEPGSQGISPPPALPGVKVWGCWSSVSVSQTQCQSQLV